MSVKEWGMLQQPTAPVPDESELSDNVRRTLRQDNDGPTLLRDGDDNDHLSVGHNGETWLLPGGGDRGDRCMEFRPKAVCDECGHVEMVQERCDSWECPKCWTRAANRQSISSGTRLQSFRYTQPENHKRQWAHVVVDLPEGDVETRRQLFDNRSTAADIAMEKGMRGCAVVPHAYRATEVGQQLYHEHVDRDEEGDPIYGLWVWIRNDSDQLGVPTSELIEWSPHYHVIGPTSPNMEPGKESDDFNYHVIRFNSHELNGVSNSEDSHKEVFGTFRYLYSHVVTPEDYSGQRTTWHGCLANNVFVEEATEDWQYEKPSEGVQQSIKRRMQELSGPTPERDDADESGEDDTDDLGECPCDDCTGRMIGVWNINDYLEQAKPPDHVHRTMRVARDWVAGEIEPPGGLKNPTCEADARLALEMLVG